jgi:hypothetical protein
MIVICFIFYIKIYPSNISCPIAFAMYVDTWGRISRATVMRWCIQPVVNFGAFFFDQKSRPQREISRKIIAFHDPYLLAFSDAHIEVRHVGNGSLLQTIPVNSRLLSSSPELMMVQCDDGRVVGLRFLR